MRDCRVSTDVVVSDEIPVSALLPFVYLFSSNGTNGRGGPDPSDKGETEHSNDGNEERTNPGLQQEAKRTPVVSEPSTSSVESDDIVYRVWSTEFVVFN